MYVQVNFVKAALSGNLEKRKTFLCRISKKYKDDLSLLPVVIMLSLKDSSANMRLSAKLIISLKF